jgi:hypothetical protein
VPPQYEAGSDGSGPDNIKKNVAFHFRCIFEEQITITAY